MKSLYSEMAKLLEKGESFAVVTVLDNIGSAPHAFGGKMVVRADNSIIGTIGGGCLEADATHLAMNVMTTKQTIMQNFELSGKGVASMDMICSGKGKLLIDFIDAGNGNNCLTELRTA